MTKRLELDRPILYALADIADQEGFDCYLVGGYVRDMLLGRERTDVDITVEGSGVEFAERVARQYNVKPVIFPRFGTAMVPIEGNHLEFVGTRKEEYQTDSRKPIVSEGSLLDDLRRRDFTVNALAIPLASGPQRVIDEFGGVADLEARLLRTPLDPVTTYSDDPLRMLRAARFAAQLGFDVQAESLEAIRELRDRIAIVSQERISEEFLKLLAAPKPGVGLALLYETGLLEHIFPELHALDGVDLVEEGSRTYAHKNVFWHTLKVVDNAAEATDNVWLRFAALMHDVGKPKTKRFTPGSGWQFHGHEEVGARWQKRIFRRMKLPVKAGEYVAKLVRLHHRPMALVEEDVTDSAIRRLVVEAGEDLDDLFTLCRADITSKNPRRVRRYLGNYDRVVDRIREVKEKDRLREFQSPVRGEEIMEICDLEPGPVVGKLKSAIEEAILEGEIPNEHDAAREYLLQIRDKFLGT